MCCEIERIPVTNSLQDKYNQLKEDYDKIVQQNYQKDYSIENQKKRISDLGKTLERYERENKALRELIALWI
jgi:predicted RNase H-like nuclease (RuvC/YqgF family)